MKLKHRKLSTRILAMGLMILMLFQMFPVSAIATETIEEVTSDPISATNLMTEETPVSDPGGSDTTSDLIEASETVAVTRAQWLQSLVELFGYYIGIEVVLDNYYPDLDPEAEYYDAFQTAIYYGLIDVLPNENVYPDAAATREFAAHTLNMCMGYIPEESAISLISEAEAITYSQDVQIALERGWFELVDGEFCPDQAITLDEKEVMLADAESYLADLEIDENHDNQYSFADDVIVLNDYADIVSNGDETSVITIQDCSETIAAGDKFVVYSDGLAIPYQADTVTVTDNMTVINATDLYFEDAIETMDVEMETDTNPANFYAAEDAELIFVEESTGTEYSQYAAARAVAKGSKSVFIPKYSKKIKLEDGASLALNVELKDTKIVYDVDVKKSTAKASVRLDTNVEVSGKLSCELTKFYGEGIEVYIGGYEIPGVGGLAVYVKVDVTGSISVVKKYHMQAGLKIDYNVTSKKCTKNHIFKLIDKGSTVNAEISAKIYLEAKFGLYGKALPLKGYLYAEAGFKAKVKYTTYSEIDGSCTHFAAYLYAEFGAKVEWKILGDTDSLNWNYELIKEENSPVKLSFHYEDGKFIGNCTRKSLTGTTTGDPSKIADSGYSTGYNSSYFGSGLSSGGSSTGYTTNNEPIIIYKYSLDDDNKATITEYSGNATSLTIPLKLDGYDVVAIGSNAFKNNAIIRTVVMQDNILTIGNSAFENCTNLRNVTLSEGLTEILSRAFRDCISLTLITIPDSVTQLGVSAFENCINLSMVDLSNNLTFIGGLAFGDCTSLKEITIPKSVVDADYYSIYYSQGPFYNSGLATVIIEQGATVVAEWLFAGANNLTSITMPTTVTMIESGAFYYCTALESISIPNSVTQINASAFANCAELESVSIPDSVTQLGVSVFEGCTALDTIKLPKTVTTIQDHTFKNCTALNTIVWNDALTTIEEYTFENCDALTEVTVPASVTQMYEGVFYDCDGLTKVMIPDSVTTLNQKMFYDCDALTNVSLGTGITSIPVSAFEHCDSLASIVLPYRVESIGNTAFKDCVALTGITIPRATTSISTTALSYADKTTIYGVAGTYAEAFAKDNGFMFKAIDIPATKVTISNNEVTPYKGKSETLTMSVTPADFTDAVSWKSGNTEVATVSDTGVVKAVGVGTTTIKLTVGNVSASCKVTVLQPVTSISLNKTSLSMEALATYTLKATVYPNNANNKSVLWSSSDEKVATVDQNGFVTAKSKGTATIIVAAQDGSNVTRTCKVTVVNNGVRAETVDQLESQHNYPINNNDFWLYSIENAENLAVTFDAQTMIEDGFDYLYIYDADGNQVGKYTGAELAGQTVTVPGNTVKLVLDSDDSGTEWGFKVTSVEAVGNHEHSYDSGKVTREATCTEKGEKVYACTCGHTKKEEIPAAGHKWDSEYTIDKPATENADGSKSIHCANCDATKGSVVIPATGTAHTHSYDSGKVTTAATCTKDGVKTFTCSCGHTKTEAIPATGHTEVTDKAVAATCTKTGLTAGKHCSVCGTVTVKQETVAKLEHKWDEGKVTKTPTAEKVGEKTFACTVCQTNKTEEIPALGVCDGKDDCPLHKFTDVSSTHWAHPGMDFAVNNSLMNGTGSGSTFEPNTNMSRAMLVTVLWRYSGSPEAPDCNFIDVTKNNWFYKAVAWAASEGVVNGVGDGTSFDPNGNVTREMMATILYRYAKMTGVDVSASASISDYPDANSVASWSSDAVKWAVAEGIISGAVKDGKTVLAPQDSANRAVVATIMMRFIQNVVES